MENNLLFPCFLKLKDKKVLVIGGGFIAFQKLTSLIATEAKLFVIAPTIIDEIYDLQGEFPNKRFINFIEREYEWGDERDAFMVIAASDLSELNSSILNRCKDQNILAMSVDNPDFSDFFIPSIASKGDLKVAVSTNGKAPGVAQEIRKRIQNEVLDSYTDIIPAINEFREKLKFKYPNSAKKRSQLIRQYTQRQLRKLINA